MHDWNCCASQQDLTIDTVFVTKATRCPSHTFKRRVDAGSVTVDSREGMSSLIAVLVIFPAGNDLGCENEIKDLERSPGIPLSHRVLVTKDALGKTKGSVL